MHTLKPISLSSICFWGPMFVYFLMDCKIYFSYAALQFLYFHTNREVFSRREKLKIKKKKLCPKL
jgi:hypothetical protein